MKKTIGALALVCAMLMLAACAKTELPIAQPNTLWVAAEGETTIYLVVTENEYDRGFLQEAAGTREIQYLFSPGNRLQLWESRAGQALSSEDLLLDGTVKMHRESFALRVAGKNTILANLTEISFQRYDLAELPEGLPEQVLALVQAAQEEDDGQAASADPERESPAPER